MSQYIDRIESTLLGNRCAIIEPLTVDIESVLENEIENPRHTSKHKVFVEWSRVFQCEMKHLPELIRICAKELKHEVYGDLKNLIRQLEYAVYERNESAALSAIRDIHREIFD